MIGHNSAFIPLLRKEGPGVVICSKRVFLNHLWAKYGNPALEGPLSVTSDFSVGDKKNAKTEGMKGRHYSFIIGTNSPVNYFPAP